ncbi:DUF551 domain-containing protein [Escherichia coli]|nr:DUF551 domain-containing protein [Escherichia coli]
MTTFTKEQLISHARKSVSYLENVKGRVSKEGADCKVVLEMVERDLELARIALTSLEAEPVAVNDDMAYAFHHALSDSSLGADEVEEIKTGLRAAFANVTIQPEPVVPEFETWFNSQESGRSICSTQIRRSLQEISWNACCAAMLQGKSEQPQNAQQNIPENIPGGNSPVTPDGWISCSERMPNDKQYVWCWGKSYGWTECNTFEGYYDWSRNKWWAVTDIGEEPASKVTHWMPLPEPPQEVNRG